MASLHDPFNSGASVANEAALSPVASFRLLFRDLSPATQFQNSGALRESFMPSKPKPCRRLTHRQVWVPGCNAALASSGAYFLRAAPEKILPRRFLLSDAGAFLSHHLFLSSSRPARAVPAKQKFSLRVRCCSACKYVCGRVPDPLELQLQMFVNCRAGAGN